MNFPHSFADSDIYAIGHMCNDLLRHRDLGTLRYRYVEIGMHGNGLILSETSFSLGQARHSGLYQV